MMQETTVRRAAARIGEDLATRLAQPRARSKKDDGVAAPVIKYAGGKRWAIPIIGPPIRDYLRATPGGRFIDPFMGGGAIPLWLGHSAMLLGDLDVDVVELHQVMKESPGELVWSLSALAIRGVKERDYYRVRNMRPKTAVMRAARFVYLNRLGFNGVHRKNKAGDCNVPYAKDTYRKHIIERPARDAVEALFPNKEKFHKAGRALEGATIRKADGEDLIGEARRGDVLYLDVPYHKAGKIYTARDFNEDDQRRIAGAARYAVARGALVIAHNHDTPLIQKLWRAPHFKRFRVAEKRQINSDIKGRSRVPCVIITNAPELLDMGKLREERAK